MLRFLKRKGEQDIHLLVRVILQQGYVLLAIEGGDRKGSNLLHLPLSYEESAQLARVINETLLQASVKR